MPIAVIRAEIKWPHERTYRQKQLVIEVCQVGLPHRAVIHLVGPLVKY